MQDLHDSGQYEKVIELLLETFSIPDEPKVSRFDLDCFALETTLKACIVTFVQSI